jgi:pimeloyl-ACP methyl ester carboxylesterase
MAPRMVTVASADSCPVEAYDEGSGPVSIIIVGGGLDDGRGYAKLAAELSGKHRVLRLRRRQYRAGAEQWQPADIADEAADVIALAEVAGRPCYLFGHSSGGVIALEAALRAPNQVDALAVFEPAVYLTELPLGHPAATQAARQAIDDGKPGRALEIFLRETVEIPAPAAKMARLLALSPRYRARLIPGQIADEEALERLGDRRSAYGGLRQHVLLVAGTTSPGHLLRRTEVLRETLPSNDSHRMEGAGHGGPTRQAGAIAKILLADIDVRTA